MVAPKRFRPHRVVMFAFDDAQVLDITGPLEVFGRAGRWLRDHGHSRERAYTVELVARRAGTVRTSSGLGLVADRSFRQVRSADTLLVTGGIGYREVLDDEAVLRWLRKMGGCCDRMGSICTGAMILAAAGLLEGMRATTHWAYCDELAAALGPGNVDADALFLTNGKVYTSAGVTAGIDMALAMVEKDWGQPVALAVAQELVLYLKRPGGQSQFSRLLAAQKTESSRLQGLLCWIVEHPEADHHVEKLAERVNMSPRNFVRRFGAEVGMTPAKYVEKVRVEAARRRLEEGGLPLETVAARSGFSSEEVMRRTFLRQLGIPPSEYRARFGTG